MTSYRSAQTLAPIPWSLQRTVAPGIPVLEIAELKAHQAITWDNDDVQIRELGLVAERTVESEISRALITQTWALRLDRFPCWEIPLPRPPLQSVTSVQYVDETGATLTLAASTYTVDTFSEPGRLYLAFDKTWPTTRTIPQAVIVTYKAGKDTGADIDERIRSMIKLTFGELYENRERGQADVLSMWRENATFERLASSCRCVTEFNYR